MGTSQVIKGVLNHIHRNRTGNAVLFNEFLETLEALIGKDLNIKTPDVPIVPIGNLQFQAAVGSVTRKDTGGLTAQR